MIRTIFIVMIAICAGVDMAFAADTGGDYDQQYAAGFAAGQAAGFAAGFAAGSRDGAADATCAKALNSPLGGFLSDARFGWLPWKLEQLPVGMSFEGQAFYSGIFHLLNDQERVLTLMETLQDDIQKSCGGVQNLRLDSLLTILQSYENEIGMTSGRIPLARRLQLHLILRDIKLRPELYGGPKDVLSLFKRLAELARRSNRQI